MKKLNASLLDEALNLLAESTESHPKQHWVVCGGSSLLALGLVSRTTTRDVDVLARGGGAARRGPLDTHSGSIGRIPVCPWGSSQSTRS